MALQASRLIDMSAHGNIRPYGFAIQMRPDRRTVTVLFDDGSQIVTTAENFNADKQRHFQMIKSRLQAVYNMDKRKRDVTQFRNSITGINLKDVKLTGLDWTEAATNSTFELDGSVTHTITYDPIENSSNGNAAPPMNAADQRAYWKKWQGLGPDGKSYDLVDDDPSQDRPKDTPPKETADGRQPSDKDRIDAAVASLAATAGISKQAAQNAIDSITAVPTLVQNPFKKEADLESASKSKGMQARLQCINCTLHAPNSKPNPEISKWYVIHHSPSDPTTKGTTYYTVRDLGELNELVDKLTLELEIVEEVVPDDQSDFPDDVDDGSPDFDED